MSGLRISKGIKSEHFLHLITLILILWALVGLATIMFLFLGVGALWGLDILLLRPFTTTWGLSETIMRTSMFLPMALGIAMAIKAGFWNIGAHGQGYMGALVAVGIGIFLADQLPPLILWPLIIVASFGAGAAWALMPAVLKVKRGVNEILVTIMLNFVAIWIVHYFCLGPWHEPGLLTKTYTVHSKAQLPILIPDTRAHAGIFIGLVATVLCFFILRYTTLGLQFRILGSNPSAARYAGIDTSRVTIIAAIISGGLAALGGVDHILGVHHYLLNGMYDILHLTGYLALGPALLGNLEPIFVALASFLFAGLITGAEMISVRVGLPGEAHLLFIGALLILILFRGFIYKFIKFRVGGGFV